MLSDENGGRGGDYDLEACQRGQRGRAKGDLGLSVTDIPDDEAVHRLTAGKVVAHRIDRPRLISGLVELKAIHEPLVEHRIGLYRRRREARAGGSKISQAPSAFLDSILDRATALLPG